MSAVLLVLGLMADIPPVTAQEVKPQPGQSEAGSSSGAIAPFPLQETPSEKKHDLAAVGQKLSDPLSDIWALFTEFNQTWSDGDLTNGHEEATHIIFQPIMPFKLTANYKLITRPTLPIIYNADLPDDLRINTNGAPDHQVTLAGRPFPMNPGWATCLSRCWSAQIQSPAIGQCHAAGAPAAAICRLQGQRLVIHWCRGGPDPGLCQGQDACAGFNTGGQGRLAAHLRYRLRRAG
jgi:hypothetical protein